MKPRGRGVRQQEHHDPEAPVGFGDSLFRPPDDFSAPLGWVEPDASMRAKPIAGKGVHFLRQKIPAFMVIIAGRRVQTKRPPSIRTPVEEIIRRFPILSSHYFS